MTGYFRGLRARIMLTLLVFAAPAFIFSVAWTTKRHAELRTVELRTTQQALLLTATKTTRLFDVAREVDAILAGQLPDAARISGPACVAAVQTALADQRLFEAGAVYRDGQEICRLPDTGSLNRLPPETLATLRHQIDQGSVIAVATAPDDAETLIVEMAGNPPAVSPGRSPFTVILRASKSAMSDILTSTTEGLLDGVTFASPGLPPLIDRQRESWAAAPPPEVPPVPTGLPVLALRQIGDRTDDGLIYFAIRPAVESSLVVLGTVNPQRMSSGNWRLWISIAQSIALLAATVIGSAWAIDRSVLRWIDYLRRIAAAHGGGHHSVRAKRLSSAPTEILDLGTSLNRMADSAAKRTGQLRAIATEKTALLVELHHRVKNNFQVITSILSLHKKSLPPDRRDNIRFIEDYIQSMSVAYRVAYDSNDMTGVLLLDLLRNVVEALRETAEIHRAGVALDVGQTPLWISLDRAIALGLYLAALLPPSLDQLRDTTDVLKITVTSEEGQFKLSVSGTPQTGEETPLLRERLLQAYIRQLKATLVDSIDKTETAILVPLDEKHIFVTGAIPTRST